MSEILKRSAGAGVALASVAALGISACVGSAVAAEPQSVQPTVGQVPHPGLVGKVNLAGRDPMFIMPSGDGRYLYVDTFKPPTGEKDDWSGEVAVVDTAARKVVQTVPVGRYPQGMTLLPGQNKLLVTNSLDKTVSVVDLSGGQLKVTGTVPAGGPAPVGIAASRQDGHTNVFIANQGSQRDQVGGSVATFSLDDNGHATPTRTVVQVGNPMGAVNMAAEGPDGRIWAATDGFDHDMFEINPVSGTVVRTLDMGTGLQPTQWGMSFLGNGHQAWIAGIRYAAKVDFDKPDFTHTRGLGDQAMDTALTKDGSYVLVSTLESGKVHVLDAQTGDEATTPADLGPGLTNLQISPDGATLYSTQSGDDNLWISDLYSTTSGRTAKAMPAPATKAPARLVQPREIARHF